VAEAEGAKGVTGDRLKFRAGSTLINLMELDLESDAKVLAAKKKIVAVLKRLPDDVKRRRVMIAAGALIGIYDLKEQ
jgi:hypothetical protein